MGCFFVGWPGVIAPSRASLGNLPFWVQKQ